MTNRELILNLQKMFNKNQTEKKSEKEMAKNLDSVESVIKGYYSKSEDVKTALGKVAEVFKIISRKGMRDKDTSPEEYNKALQVMYFSEESIRKLKELLPGSENYFKDVKEKLKKDCRTNPIYFASTMKKINKILDALMASSSLSLENTDLPALVCYLLKLKKRIKKYNNMVEKANAGKEAERDTGARPVVKFEEREREKSLLEEDDDDDDDDDLTSSTKSQDEKPAPPEGNPQQDDWELLGEDSSGIKKVLDTNKVIDLNECARSLRNLVKNAKTIHSATQTNYSGSGLEAGARDLGQRIKVRFWGKDSNNLVTISDKLGEIAGYIDNLKNDPKMGDISAANKVSTDTINLINEYEKNKITKDEPLHQKKEDFVKTSREYLENIRDVTEIYSNNKIKKIADEISSEINGIKDPTDPSESSANLRKLADIALEIRDKTKNIQQAKDYAAKVPLFDCFDAVLSKAKDIALAAENAVGYDQNNLQNISNYLNNIAENDIQKSNYKTFKKDIEAVRTLLNGYQTDKMNNKKDALTDVREEFISKTTTHLDIVEGVSKKLTPEKKLEEIVNRLSNELKKIDIQKEQMPGVYAEQLKQLAKIGPEIRKETQDLQNYSNFWKSVTDSAQTLADMFTHINENNISNISKNLNIIAKKIPNCDLDEINKTEDLVQKYAVKKSGVTDDLSTIRSNFATKVTECLREVKEITQAFNELKNDGEQNNEKITSAVTGALSTVKKDKAQQFRNYIENKFDICQELESEEFINDVLPSSSKMKQITDDIVEKFTTGLKETDSLFGWKKHVGNIFELVADKFLKGKNDTIKKNIKKCFENINSTNKDEYPKTKCEEVLNNIKVWNNATFKSKIDTIQKMGDSYSVGLVQLKQRLGQIIYEFYGCNTKNEVSVPSVGADFSKFINIFSYQDLFSNVVSLYNNFNEEINDPIKDYPIRYLKSEVENNKQKLEAEKTNLENTDTLWDAKGSYNELYNKIRSYVELLEKEKLTGNSNLDINVEVFGGSDPKTDKELAEGISNYLKEMGIAIGTVRGWISSSEVVTMKAKDDEGNEIDRKHICDVLTACKRKMEREGFNKFDKNEYNKFKESYNNFKDNCDYLKTKGYLSKEEPNNG